MKKRTVVLLLMVTLAKIFALGTGDEALEVKSKFYNSKIFKARFYVVDAKNRDKLKVLVFARLLADDFLQAEPLINNIGSRKNVSLAFASPSEAEIGTFLKMKPHFNYALLYDREAHKNYMEQNIIYPRAFVINYQNKIIWDGELIDLPDMLDKFAAGKYDLEVNRKINRYLSEMQNALRAGSEYQLDRAARAILALDHGNLPCLRMRMFAFENTNRHEEAWKFLDEFRRKYPDEKYLYMLQIDMGGRYAAFAERGAAVAAEFVKRPLGRTDEQLLLSWMLVNHYNYSIEALESAEKLLSKLNENSFKEKQQKGLYNRALALAAYKRGDLAEAVKKQQRACDVFDNAEFRKILEFYKKLQKK